ncbi:MAG TPA: thiamine phosphate synthase [Chloroflexota bacterium]|jgi:thiamine-phosphate diphosphorylase
MPAQTALVVGRLHLVTDLSVPLGLIAAAVDGGVDAVHLRDHAATAADLLARARAIKALLGRRAQLVVNDRLDVALAADADAAQLGHRSLPLPSARRVAPALPLGASIHSLAEAALAADFFLLGTIFASRSHPGQPGAGLALIEQVARATRQPVVAIGGIDAGRARACRAAGAHGVAVISAVVAAPDPGAAAAAIRRELES